MPRLSPPRLTSPIISQSPRPPRRRLRLSQSPWTPRRRPMSQRHHPINQSITVDTTPAPNESSSNESVNHLGHHASADGLAALAEGESQALLDRHRMDCEGTTERGDQGERAESARERASRAAERGAACGWPTCACAVGASGVRGEARPPPCGRGVLSSHVTSALSPGITISRPSLRVTAAVTSAVRKKSCGAREGGDEVR